MDTLNGEVLHKFSLILLKLGALVLYAAIFIVQVFSHSQL